MLNLLVILKRNPLAVFLTLCLLISIAAFVWKMFQVQSLNNQLAKAQVSLSKVVNEKNELRKIIDRNNAAVRALKKDREILSSDFAELRKQLEEAEYEDCLDAVNRALGN